MTPSPVRIAALLCVAETLAMTGFAAYPAFLPTLREAWGMSGAQAGFVGGAFFCGYMLAVPFLSGATDRVDARGVLAFSCMLTAAGTAGFALLADGVVSAALFQALAGAGLAGTYMPGLKALTDRVGGGPKQARLIAFYTSSFGGGPKQARLIAFYTSSFGVGTSLSLLLAGWAGAQLPWRWAFALLAVGPLAALPLVWFGLAAHEPHGAHHAPWWPRFGPVLAQRETRRYILGYAVHCWELLGLRSWLVAFIVFAYANRPTSAPLLGPTEAAALINLIGLPASILGNEMAARVGRTRWIAAMMTASGLLCWLAGFAAGWPTWLMLLLLALYYVTTMADSAALTAGLVAASPPAQRGAAMAVHSLFGFGSGFAAPLVFGATLDAAGGDATAWVLAFGTLGAGGLIWALSMRSRSGGV